MLDRTYNNGIKVVSDGFDIRIEVLAFDGEIHGAMVNKVFGYVHKTKAQAKFTLTYEPDTGVATFAVAEPTGWVSKKDSYIAIALPRTIVSQGINIDAFSNKGDILIGEGEKIKVGSLGVSSAKGDVTVSNVDIAKELNIDIGSGLIFVDDNADNVVGARNVGMHAIQFKNAAQLEQELKEVYGLEF